VGDIKLPQDGGITRVLIFALLDDNRMVVERTGYRGNQTSEAIPRIYHHGGSEDDLMYAKDQTVYIRSL
jgi:hypothetical protein